VQGRGARLAGKRWGPSGQVMIRAGWPVGGYDCLKIFIIIEYNTEIDFYGGNVSKYTGIQKEETLKGLIFKDFFDGKKFGYEPNIDNIDFVITDVKTRGDLFVEEGSGASAHYLWAEAKKGIQDVESMLTQLLLTCKKTYEKAEYHAPPFIGCFDTEKIAFVPFHDILPIFHENDINWNTTPSNHDVPDFQKARSKIVKLILANLMVYRFGDDDHEIKEFIKIHFAPGANTGIKNPITKDNFVQVFTKWVKDVEPAINISKEDWADFKANGILECDFYRADMMSIGGNTISISEKLKIILEKDNYKLQEHIKGRLFSTIIDFTDGGETYRRFWNKYKRPPVNEYQQYIIDRRDLLVPQNIREVKGSFFTPEIWVKKSQEYITKVFGENWQEEYFVWDCAAGTGNLLARLSKKYNVWASTIDQSDIDTINALIDIDEQLNLLPNHVFQFDFLNDNFGKLPAELKKIIDDPEKRKKLIIYINPPYAEVSSLGAAETKGRKAGVNQSIIHDKYAGYLGTAGREMFALFLARIYFEIPGCKIGEFSTLKSLNGSALDKFREFFKAKLEKCFIVPANTFDNVGGQFPIGFKVWDTDKKEIFESITADIFDANNNFIGNKTFYAFNKTQFINKWIGKYKAEGKETIGYMDGINGNDFQHNNIVYIINSKELLPNPRGIWINEKNIFECSIYFAIRHCFEHTWVNHNDQFLYPNNDRYKTDTEFQNDCLIYTLFHGKNTIQSQYGINHWIPFTPEQTEPKETFESVFMSNFLKDRARIEPFSVEAQSVYNAGLGLWRYYHAKIKNNNTVSVNASFYDIRLYFQGRNDRGTMNSKSEDETYNYLLEALKDALKALGQKIQQKVYEYGFLKE
jgi:hypothetical protein